MIVAAVALLASSAVQAAPLFRYVVTGVASTDLGTLGGNQSAAADINNAGTIVGWAEEASGVRRAFRYSGGAMSTLASSTLGTRPSEATGINVHGRVAGTYIDGDDTHAFSWLAGSLITLVDLSPWGDPLKSSATAINDSGQIVGQRAFVDHDVATFWSSPGTFHALAGDIYPYSSFVRDVNNAGHVVGREKNFDTTRVWRWSGTGISSVRVPVPASTATGSYPPNSNDALGINNVGTVVGFATFRPTDGSALAKHAMHWNGTNINSSDLGVLPSGVNSVADDINNDDFVVGYADRLVTYFPPFTMNLDSGFLFHRDFGMYALPRPAFAIWSGNCRAKALNERNASNGVIQVVGTCDTAYGTRAVRWDVTVALRSTLPPGTGP